MGLSVVYRYCDGSLLLARPRTQDPEPRPEQYVCETTPYRHYVLRVGVAGMQIYIYADVHASTVEIVRYGTVDVSKATSRDRMNPQSLKVT